MPVIAMMMMMMMHVGVGIITPVRITVGFTKILV